MWGAHITDWRLLQSLHQPPCAASLKAGPGFAAMTLIAVSWVEAGLVEADVIRRRQRRLENCLITASHPAPIIFLLELYFKQTGRTEKSIAHNYHKTSESINSVSHQDGLASGSDSMYSFPNNHLPRHCREWIADPCAGIKEAAPTGGCRGGDGIELRMAARRIGLAQSSRIAQSGKIVQGSRKESSGTSRIHQV